jgi:flagellar basal-body rod modification protein FlgD
MDSTAMVGQMISLNQLDQLVSINSDLTPTTTAAVKAKTQAASSSNILANSVNGSQGMSSNALMSAQSALMNNASTSSSVNAASLAASDPSTTLDLTNINSQFGGK